MSFTREQKKLINLIQKWFDLNEIETEDTVFYTKEAWLRRGESYCNDESVVLNITTEGPFNHILNMYDGVELFDSFCTLLDDAGYWFEMGTSWYLCIYKSEA